MHCQADPADHGHHGGPDDDGDDDDSDACPLQGEGDLSGEQLDELDRELGLASGSESPPMAMAEAVRSDGDPLDEMLAEFDSPADEAAPTETAIRDEVPGGDLLADFPSPTDEAASTTKPTEVVEVLESPMKVEPVSPATPKKNRKAHVFQDDAELQKASQELARLKAKQSERQVWAG